MKTLIRFKIMVLVAMVFASQAMYAQKFDEERMKRDIEVAENVLSTLIKQQFNNQRSFFPLEIKGSYQAGYGVTFTIPADFTTPIVFSMAEGNNDQVMIWGNEQGNGSFSYSYEVGEEDRAVRAANNDSYRLREKPKTRKSLNMDSVREAYNLKVIDAAKTFLVDYGDMITQLGNQEKIIVSNQGNQPRMWVNHYFNSPERTHLAVEASKADLTALKQGKISREQALAKLRVLNTETVETVEPDLELLSSIFSRLYRQDLSKTFFTEDNLYYERLKEFGVIYYMQVYSYIPIDYNRYAMPTLKLNNVDTETRNKKVIELYPQFEKELKENILEYGRTLKSIGDEEVLVFQVALTRCANCGIPSSLEYTVKGSVLKDFSSGKVEKNSALGKISIKKGPNQ